MATDLTQIISRRFDTDDTSHYVRGSPIQSPRRARPHASAGNRKLTDHLAAVCFRRMMLASPLMSSGLMVGGAATLQTQRFAPAQMAAIGDTLASIQGPDLYWEEKGPLQDPPLEESDFKEYDTFSLFLDACSKNGVDLNQDGITCLAPSNKACAEFSATYGELTKAICEYHLIKGVVKTDALGSSDLTTVEGSKVTYRRMFRKDFLDNAFCAAQSSPPRTSYQGNIAADNGLIHMINEVIYPGWSESAGGYGSAGDPAATRA